MYAAWLTFGLLYTMLCLLIATSAATQNETWCWGDGISGQLGDGVARNTSYYESGVPVLVAGNHSFSTVCTGGGFSCALEPSGKAWCWGRMIREGSEGFKRPPETLSFPNSTTPVEAPSNHSLSSITCGGDHVCGLDDTGAAYCFGDNRYGRLGTSEVNVSNVFVEAAAGHKFTALCAGMWHTCGLDAIGQAWCWGSNGNAQLGVGPPTKSELPLAVAGNHTFQSISCGFAHTCALEPPPSSKAWCWGYGINGQLGNGANNFEQSPTPVLGSHAFSAISGGGFHTAALGLNGTLWSWGDFGWGGVPTSQPAEYIRNRTFVALSAGDWNTCALDDAGDIWCFGPGPRAGLGDGSTDYKGSNVPVKVVGGHKFLSLEHALFNTVCAIATTEAGT